jgi:hypothetical protein
MKFPSSPWGAVQHEHELAPGIVSVSTASHGGIHVAAELLERIPRAWRDFAAKWSGSAAWFEEDCAACGVIVSFPELFSDEALECAKRTAEHYGLPSSSSAPVQIGLI